jgi:hypothetical protein
MASPRTISTLTEGWPEAPENYDLQAFAATVRDERPELSAPALDRIADQLSAELDRRTHVPDRPPTRWQLFRAHAFAGTRMIAPYAAAASLLISGGVWVHHRVTTPAAESPQGPGRLVNDERPPENAPEQPRPALPDPASNAPRGG